MTLTQSIFDLPILVAMYNAPNGHVHVDELYVGLNHLMLELKKYLENPDPEGLALYNFANSKMYKERNYASNDGEGGYFLKDDGRKFLEDNGFV